MSNLTPITSYFKCSCGACSKFWRIAYNESPVWKLGRLTKLRVQQEPLCVRCRVELNTPILEKGGWK